MGLVKGEGFAVDASVLEANASRYHGKAPEELDWSEKQRQSRAVTEYLAALDETAEPNPERKAPKAISPSDPCSAWTAKANKRVQFGYGLNYPIDTDNAVIVDVEATPARTSDEVAATKTMIDRTEQCFALKPKRLAADTAYGTGKFLGWLVKDKGITPHIPVWEKSERADGIFSRADFIWDKRHGHYVCPNGKKLRTSGTVHDGRTLLYRASKRDCDVCPLKPRCCTRNAARKIPRDVHEDARDVARRKMKTKAFARSRDERKRVEMRFAHLKTHHGFDPAAATRPRRRTRRVPPCGHRAEPQDHGAADGLASARPHGRVSCVSLGALPASRSVGAGPSAPPGRKTRATQLSLAAAGGTKPVTPPTLSTASASC